MHRARLLTGLPGVGLHIEIPLGHARVHIAWTYAITANPVLPVLQGNGPGQIYHAPLCGTVRAQ